MKVGNEQFKPALSATASPRAPFRSPQLRGENFDLFEKSGEKAHAQSLHARIISLRRLHEPVINKIDAGSTSFWAAKNKSTTEVAGLGILERQRVKVWLNNAYEQLDSLHL